MAGAPCIALVAGEASGDLIGGGVITALRRRLPDVSFVGIGGPHMVAAGLQSWFPQEKLAVHGLVEVLAHLRELFAIRGELVRRLVDLRPALFLGIDSPDFNLGIERKLKRTGVTTAHMVSPTVWAWRSGRIRTIRAAVDHMLVLFPFEEPIYHAAGIPATYIGHPLADEIPEGVDQAAAREDLRLPQSAPVIAVLPGSRRSEIERMAPPFIRTVRQVIERVPETRFLVPLITRETRDLFEGILYREQARDLPMSLLFGHAQEALAACDVALATSGTVTLEAALVGRPMVIAYCVAPLTYAIGRRLIRVEHMGLPNILAGESVVPEFVQAAATPDNLAQALVNLLLDEQVRATVRDRFAELHGILRRDAAETAARALMPYLGVEGARATT
ncbi:MAG: lipid-A-disaccharide synthase [Betaproteobacteria bacterium]|jgi:lipid-A-disaccharide synthase|nr:lipid-A-disaccharide synthase [Betaproteobacteria bacterium]